MTEEYYLVPKKEYVRELTVKVGKNKFVIKNLNTDQLNGAIKLAQNITRFVPNQPSILAKITKVEFKIRKEKNDD